MDQLIVWRTTNSFLILLSWVMVCFITGCSSDDNESIQWASDPQAVRINATFVERENGPVPRIADSEHGSVWENGDEITVCEIISNRSVNYTYNGTIWEPTIADKYLRWEEGATGMTSFAAWRPASSSINGYTDFILPQDQSGGITLADWMTARTTSASGSDGTILLAFARQMAKVTMIVKSWNEQFEMGDEITDFRMQSTSSQADVAGRDGTPIYIKSQNDNGKTKLPALNADRTPTNVNDCPSYTAIVFPTSAQSTQLFMKCKVKGYDLTLTGIPELKAGFYYTFDITVGKAAITISNVIVNDWATGGDIEGDAPEQH